jgi:NAD(P)-dependent dehydrogenase (short-subunit alcohol dehydrogenase family)
MARIFITGSADGLGQMAAKFLSDQGHKVVLHARNAARAEYALNNVPNAIEVVSGDLAVIDEIKTVAYEANKLGPFDAVIHNAGVYHAADDEIFTVNVLAPYLLTCLIEKPKRLIYLSSGMHQGGRVNLESMAKTHRVNYSDSKLYVLMLAKAVARLWPDVYSNAVDPGWVPTKMGGPGAPDDLQKGYETQAWLAVSNDEKAKVSGRYFFHQKEKAYNQTADNIGFQEKLLAVCEEITGIGFSMI